MVFIYFCPFLIVETYIQRTNFGVNLHKSSKVIGEKFSWCTTLVFVWKLLTKHDESIVCYGNHCFLATLALSYPWVNIVFYLFELVSSRLRKIQCLLKHTGQYMVGNIVFVFAILSNDCLITLSHKTHLLFRSSSCIISQTMFINPFKLWSRRHCVVKIYIASQDIAIRTGVFSM